MCYTDAVLYLGASGFSYNDWVGPFYPLGMPKREWLSYYSREFNACEINSTFYAVPKPSTMESMAKKTEEGFIFVIKANQQMTHERRNSEEVFDGFRKALEPLIERRKMGCVLAQFPYSFRFNAKNRDYLELFRERMGDLPIVIEFRNAQWLRQEVFDWLRHNELGFCCVDEPQLPNLLPPIAEATSNIAYVRFHGRNAAKWWQHEHAYERYDYSYSAEELEEWLPKIRHLDQVAETTFVFANNHWRGQAVATIRQLRMMLE
jgi:uncharacterized protein YecE (DUF72 family)